MWDFGFLIDSKSNPPLSSELYDVPSGATEIPLGVSSTLALILPESILMGNSVWMSVTFVNEYHHDCFSKH